MIDGPMGAFDTRTDLILGCGSIDLCRVFIPYKDVSTPIIVLFEAADANTDLNEVLDELNNRQARADMDFGSVDSAVFATVAPVPASILLLCTDLAGGAAMRHRNAPKRFRSEHCGAEGRCCFMIAVADDTLSRWVCKTSFDNAKKDGVSDLATWGAGLPGFSP